MACQHLGGRARSVIPSTLVQAALILLLVLPGTVYQIVRSRVRGPSPDDASATNRVLRALGASALLLILYVLTVGNDLIPLITDSTGAITRVVMIENAEKLARWALVLLVMVPATCSIAVYQVSAKFVPWLRRRHPWIPRLSYNPIPRAWDFAFQHRQHGYVRVLYDDGSYQGGYYGPASFASGYPEPREVFLETAWLLNTDGSFQEEVAGSAGVFIVCEQVRVVEFLAPVYTNTAKPQPEPTDLDVGSMSLGAGTSGS
jgi:Family of unknown function (DUF6338)